MLFQHNAYYYNNNNTNIISKKNSNKNNQDIIYFKKICREMKTTLFPNARYIIPRYWFDEIMNHNLINPLNNVQFLNQNKTFLKETIDERNIVIIIYEIMNYIHSTFLYDYIIEAKTIFNNSGIIIIKDIKVMGYHEFIEPDFRNGEKYKVNESYLKYPLFQISINNNKNKEKKKDIISSTENESTSIISKNKYNYNPESKELFVLDIFEKIYIEPIGIINKSIYCYMISCLQILLSIPELNYYFLHKKYKNSEQKTLICDDFSDFISLYKYSEKNHETKIDLPSSIYEISNTFLQRGVMNDCQEFFILFLKSIQEELNLKSNIQNHINYRDKGNDIEKIWMKYRKENYSFVDGLFTGLMRSTVICDKCNGKSYNYEPFMDLSVPIPKKNKSIIKCLDTYFDFEKIDCNYNCDQCNLKTNVSIIKILFNFY